MIASILLLVLIVGVQSNIVAHVSLSDPQELGTDNVSRSFHVMIPVRNLLCNPIVGRAADRFGRRPVIIVAVPPRHFC